MDILMRVHRVSTHHVERTVIHEDEEATAMVAELEVELSDSTGSGHGTIMLHFRSQAKIAEAKAMFTHGGVVTMTHLCISMPRAAAVSTMHASHYHRDKYHC